MKKTSLVLFAASCALLSLSAPPTAVANDHEVKTAASEKQASSAITFRKSLLQLVRSNMGPLGAMAKGNIPMDADVIALNANRIAFLGEMMHDYFNLDTSAYSLDTEAKADIWKEHADYTAKINDLVDAAVKLEALVANEEKGEYRKGIGALGGTCKACHDKYKQD